MASRLTSFFVRREPSVKRSITIVLLVGFLLSFATIVHSSDPNYDYPANVDSWSTREWEAMTPRDRWFFLHGFYLGTYGSYNSLAEGYRLSETREKQRQRLEGIGRILDIDVNELLADLSLQIALGRHRTDPLWLIPYLRARSFERPPNENNL